MTGQGEWPVGACSRQTVCRLVVRYTHRLAGPYKPRIGAHRRLVVSYVIWQPTTAEIWLNKLKLGLILYKFTSQNPYRSEVYQRRPLITVLSPQFAFGP